MVRMPEAHVRWTEIRRELHRVMRAKHGILGRQIHSVEGFAGSPDGDTDEGDGLALCTRAFDGDVRTLKRFTLYAWDEASRSFQFARAASEV